MPLLTGCGSASLPPQPQLVHSPVPDSLTQATPTPQFPARLQWGHLATWGDEMIDALESCNADKRAIKKLDAQRAQREAEHAEN
ncbi:Rz1-like lysis system protein LysC [Pantoea agglomerans]|uniref:Rz1-like lysis system protein LysC n=1 Tax=Enterobacter agglomerans TaxID=549 RepID=UPI003DA0277A